MDHQELQAYLHKHCKIKLRSGKEVFGVLWEEYVDNALALCFASNVDHQRILSAVQTATSEILPNIKVLDLDDILQVENLN